MAGLILGCNSSRQYYYMQNTHQVPLFKQKKEFRLSADGSWGSETSGSNIQMAGSISDKFALMVSWQRLRNKNTYTQNGVTDDTWEGTCLDGAFGYFRNLKNYGVFEVYGGVGRSAQHHAYTGDTSYQKVVYFPFWGYDTISQSAFIVRGTADISFLKLYIQPQYGLSFRAFDLALSMRISNLYFNSVQNTVHKSYSGFEEVEFFKRIRNHAMMEPALTIRTGWKFIKLQFQMGRSFLLNPSSFRMEDEHYSLGLTFAYAERFSKKFRR